MPTPAKVAARRRLIKSCDPNVCADRVMALEQTLREALSPDEFTSRRAQSALREIGIDVVKEKEGRCRAIA